MLNEVERRYLDAAKACVGKGHNIEASYVRELTGNITDPETGGEGMSNEGDYMEKDGSSRRRLGYTPRTKRKYSPMDDLRQIVSCMDEYGQLEHETEVMVWDEDSKMGQVQVKLIDLDESNDEAGGKNPAFTLSWAGRLPDGIGGRPMLRIKGPKTDVLVSPIPKFVLAILMEA